MWKWWQFLYAQVPPETKVLNMNLDETSMQLWQARHRGNVGFRKWPSVRKVREKVASRATLKMQRSSITLVAMVCDDVDIQRRLPQVLIASHQVVLPREAPLINALLPSNVFFVRTRMFQKTQAL